MKVRLVMFILGLDGKRLFHFLNMLPDTYYYFINLLLISWYIICNYVTKDMKHDELNVKRWDCDSNVVHYHFIKSSGTCSKESVY